MITTTTKFGYKYETPYGLNEDEYYDMIYLFMEMAKEKRLTVKQAQKLFMHCSDAVLSTKL